MELLVYSFCTANWITLWDTTSLCDCTRRLWKLSRKGYPESWKAKFLTYSKNPCGSWTAPLH